MAQADWTKIQIEVRHEPRTGIVKPWEIWAVFPDRRVHWSSFKTQAAAEKKAAAQRAKFSDPVWLAKWMAL